MVSSLYNSLQVHTPCLQRILDHLQLYKVIPYLTGQARSAATYTNGDVGVLSNKVSLAWRPFADKYLFIAPVTVTVTATHNQPKTRCTA